jgi:peroxiredoxin
MSPSSAPPVSCVCLVKNHLWSDRAPDIPHAVSPGTRLTVDGIDWRASRKTLLVALQAGCKFCAQSAPFYRRLADEASTHGVRLIALLPQPSNEARSYLEELNVPIFDIKDARRLDVPVRATPTLILVDNQGVVTKSWQGLLHHDKEDEVLTLVK